MTMKYKAEILVALMNQPILDSTKVDSEDWWLDMWGERVTI